MSLITESIDSHEHELYEAFEKLTSFIHGNRFTNADIKRSNLILKNLTKQIWTKFVLFKRRQKSIAQNKQLPTIPMDKKFLDEFLRFLKADPEIIENVNLSVGREMRSLNSVYRGVRTRKISKEDFHRRKEQLRIDPTVIIAKVINSIALETTLKYLDERYDDLDMNAIEDRNKRKLLRSMGNFVKTGTKNAIDGIVSAADARSKKV